MAYFDFNELNEIAYDIAIDDSPFGFDKFKISKESLLLANEYGKKFFCRLPKLPSNSESEKNFKKQNLTVNLISEVASAAFYVKNCVSRNYGWWTYEVCFGQEVRQFHGDGSLSDNSAIFLGFYGNDSYVDESKKGPYYEQFYSNGSVCDLTNHARQVRVMYLCDENLQTNEAYIASVEEPSLCQYKIAIKTGSLCKLHPFNSVNKRRPKLKIQCHPVLNQVEADAYIQKKINEAKLKESMLKEANELLLKADSIQRQRLARKRLSLAHLGDEKMESEIELKLVSEYKAAASKASTLRAKAEGLEIDLHIISDSLFPTKQQYISDEDEDRGNIYWYFMDRFWDRSFYPVKVAYARPRRNFNNLLRKGPLDFLIQYGGQKTDNYKQFLADVDKGFYSEEDLEELIGPLNKAFSEFLLLSMPNLASCNYIPGISFFFKDTSIYTSRSSAFWTDSEVQAPIFRYFEKHVMNNNLDQSIFDADDIMAKIARQLLQIKSALKSKSPEDDYFFTYKKIEELYEKFEQSFNRGIKLSDIKMRHLEHLFEDAFKNGNMDMVDSYPVKNLKLENIQLLHTDIYQARTVELDGKKTNLESFREPQPKSEMNEAMQGNVLDDEENAKLRMFQRAKRKNLRAKIEEYLDRDDFIGDKKRQGDVKQMIEQIKTKLSGIKDLLVETGLFNSDKVEFHLVTADGDTADYKNYKNVQKGDRILVAMMKAYIDEYDMVKIEADRYENLRKGYDFDAPDESIATEKDDDIISDFKAKLLPILRDAF
ncbi:unnamed protein product [Dracunculus medinensis]|uniref:PRKCSH domain-containing protein n=1 Tax=Dracunculus medinensis TaxID=318479 RepID=A0A0N4U248_DRAME|nr:unnamed protein product [Dracunculus medinensis]